MGEAPLGAFSWTDERVSDLKRWWREGLSASRIAKLIGFGVSRSAVLGKVHRLGIADRGAPSVPVVRRVPSWKPKAAAVPAAPLSPKRGPLEPPRLRVVVDPVAEERAFHGKLVDLLDLTEHQCRWPIGSVGEPGFGFCGQRARPQAHIAGAPMYCEDHGRRAGDGVRHRQVSPFYGLDSITRGAARKAGGE